jgi:hypothetical protein
MFLTKPYTFQRTTFYVGLGLWFIGFVGNIAHDEILLNIRRKAKAKAKGKKNNGDNNSDNDGDAKPNGSRTVRRKNITRFLAGCCSSFKFISYPNCASGSNGSVSLLRCPSSFLYPSFAGHILRENCLIDLI